MKSDRRLVHFGLNLMCTGVLGSGGFWTRQSNAANADTGDAKRHAIQVNSNILAELAPHGKARVDRVLGENSLGLKSLVHSASS